MSRHSGNGTTIAIGQERVLEETLHFFQSFHKQFLKILLGFKQNANIAKLSATNSVVVVCRVNKLPFCLNYCLK